MTHTILQKPPRDRSTARRRLDADMLVAAFATDLGWMALAHADEVFRGIVFGHTTRRNAIDALGRSLGHAAAVAPSIDILEIDDWPTSIFDVVDRLTSYAAGEFVDLRGVRIDERHLTDFGRRIVRACRRIPRGQTQSYGELAAASGSPGAARAVGQAMAKNRYPLIVPCHRVLAAAGRIGGFSSPQGLTMKRRLLSLEGQSRFTC